jgi:septum site-determining protein MinC
VRTPAPITQALSIRGRGDGLAIEIGKGVWAEIMAALAERLEQSASFFRAARIALDVGPRPVLEDELQQLLKLVERYDMTIGAVRTSTERTFQSALALGLTVTLESTDGAPVADATPAATNVTTAAYFVYRGYLRSGHRLKRKEHVLVIGDVNPGAEVISDGDILVWGRLRGFAHAGANGNRRAIVAALDLEPTQLRIADVTTIGPDPKMGQPGKWFWNRSRTKRPEIARIVNQVILLDEWDATRPGGLVSLRRGAV